MWNTCAVFIILALLQQFVIEGEGWQRPINRTKFLGFDTAFDNIAWTLPHQSNLPSSITRDIAYLPEHDYNDNSGQVETTIDEIENESPQQLMERVDRNLRPDGEGAESWWRRLNDFLTETYSGILVRLILLGPIDMENGAKRNAPEYSFRVEDMSGKKEYRSLCEMKTRKVQLSNSEYEYQPPHYLEIYCKSYSLLDRTSVASLKPHRQLCAHPGFHCVQRSRTISLMRRRWSGGECWEPYTKEIASGCDCMWPVSTLGDITAHY